MSDRRNQQVLPRIGADVDGTLVIIIVGTVFLVTTYIAQAIWGPNMNMSHWFRRSQPKRRRRGD
ncbi:hypothetical protein EV189_0831 [Motilibacter rhizosphaerae]|uniref:Uncharacterized protein n=1 Tax=Motilibacter rhizosphaerae TaxID=598652 RepID=A0A4Q7NWL9_9ACTN|nr:hypothetical protein EV189_0831 [Motilibacter rhizosphaerae]